MTDDEDPTAEPDVDDTEYGLAQVPDLPLGPMPALYGADERPPTDAPEPDRTAAARVSLPAQIMATKEHRRFLEFAEAVRRKRYVGLCYGAPGVGKSESARAYTRWDQLAPHLAGTRATGTDPTDARIDEVLASRAVL